MFLDRFRKRIIQAKTIPASMEVLDIDTLDTLKRDFNPVFETANCYFAFDSGGLVRVRKENFSPTIRKVNKVSIQPTDTKVYLPKKELFSVATEQGHVVWETKDAFLLLSTGLVLICEKNKKVK